MSRQYFAISPVYECAHCLPVRTATTHTAKKGRPGCGDLNGAALINRTEWGDRSAGKLPSKHSGLHIKNRMLSPTDLMVWTRLGDEQL